MAKTGLSSMTLFINFHHADDHSETPTRPAGFRVQDIPVQTDTDDQPRNGHRHPDSDPPEIRKGICRHGGRGKVPPNIASQVLRREQPARLPDPGGEGLRPGGFARECIPALCGQLGHVRSDVPEGF